MKKQKRILEKKNKIMLFLKILLLVLLIGMVILAGLIMRKMTATQQENEQEQKWEELDKSMEQPTEPISREEADESRYGALLADEEKMREENIHALEGRENGEVTLLFAGDILFDEGYTPMIHLNQKGQGIFGVFSEELMQLMQAADIFMLNNEFPYSTGGEPLEGKQYTFRALPETASFLADMGVEVVSLANNHAYDYGKEALLDTFSALDRYGISYVGAGHDLAEASGAIYYVVNDYKIGILSATQIERLDHPDTKSATETEPGVFRCWNIGLLLQQIEAVKADCDYLVVYIHWGTENESGIDWAQEEQAAKIAEAGADLIVGTHPHCLQKIARVKGVPVIYSLGNFWFNSKSLDTGLFKVTIDTQTGEEKMQFIPAAQQGCETKLLEGTEKERVLSYMTELSTPITLDENGFFE